MIRGKIGIGGMLAGLALLGAANVSAQYTVHILHPFANDPARLADPLRIISAVIGPPFPGNAMTAEGRNWYTYTWNLPRPAANTQFFFQSYIPTQFNVTANAMPYYGCNAAGGQDQFTFGDTFFRLGVNEIWIIPGTGCPRVTDVPQALKVAMLFSPWPENGPMARIGGATAYANMKMSPDPTRCGWYGAFFNAAPFTVHFKSIFGTDVYGMGGMGSAQTIDLATSFANHDTVFIIPTPYPGGAPVVQFTLPAGMKGTCSFPLGVTVRDFSKNHPAFEKPDMASDVASTGMVGPTLDAERKPVVGPRPYARQQGFDKWFRDDSTNADATMKNYTTCRDLPMSRAGNGLWGHDSYTANPSRGYFPIDDFNRFGETFNSQYIDRTTGAVGNDPTGKPHNFHFCMEMHATFKYKQGQEFKFNGDDDTWAFINNKLVMDLGGPHPALAGAVRLDTIRPALVPNQSYNFDFFICERHTTGSNLLIETSIFFEQQQSVLERRIVLGEGGIRWEIFQINSGDARCGSTKGGDTTEAKNSRFVLSGPGANPPVTLPAGNSYGGISINGSMSQVTVDSTKIVGLRPGLYTIDYTIANGSGGRITFIVPGISTLEFSDKRIVNEVVGTRVQATIQAVANGQPDNRAEGFTLNVPPGLQVYSDAAMTIPITSTTPLTTDAATGSKVVYATSNTAGTYDLLLIGGPTKVEKLDNFPMTFYKQPKVEIPVATPAGHPFILPPVNVSLSTPTLGAQILYTVDGTTPDTVVGGSTRLYTPGTPIVVTGNTTIKAIAVKAGWLPSDLMTEIYVYVKPVLFSKAWYLDKDGDGTIESAIVDFMANVPNPPDSLAFQIQDGAGTMQRRVAPRNQLSVAATRVTVGLVNPFPKGLTSVPNPDASGQMFRQDNIPFLAGNFRVDDSVAPILIQAEVFEPDSTQPLKRVILDYSEPVQFPAASQAAQVWKRAALELNPGQVSINRIESSGPAQYTVYINANSEVFPIVGDSVAINTNSETRDGQTNTPAVKLFVKLKGTVPPPKPLGFFVTFPNETRDKASAGMQPPDGKHTFIPVAQDGSPLANACGGCSAGANGNFVGPVFHIITPSPVHFKFKIFSTLGDFIAEGDGDISAADLEKSAKTNDASGINYDVRIVWTGRTSVGSKAGSGAYILHTELKSQKDDRTGAPPAKLVKQVVFGLLRSFRGS